MAIRIWADQNNQERIREQHRAFYNATWGKQNAEYAEACLRQDKYGAIVADIAGSPLALSTIAAMTIMAWSTLKATGPILVAAAVLGGCIICIILIIQEIGKTLSRYIFPERPKSLQK